MYDLLRASRREWPFGEKVWADAANQGARRLCRAYQRRNRHWSSKSKRVNDNKRRRVAERTPSSIGRNRPLSRDVERLAVAAICLTTLAAAFVLVKRFPMSVKSFEPSPDADDVRHDRPRTSDYAASGDLV
jgi:hypothetical protein